jgi:hypothetical protein
MSVGLGIVWVMKLSNDRKCGRRFSSNGALKSAWYVVTKSAEVKIKVQERPEIMAMRLLNEVNLLITYYDAEISNQCKSASSLSEHNHTLYARYNAIPEDSITFVRRRAKPISVRKMSAVMDAPSSVDASGDAAA